MSKAQRTRATQLELFDVEAAPAAERSDHPGRTAAPDAASVFKGTAVSVISSDSPIVEGGRVITCDRPGCSRPAALVARWAEGSVERWARCVGHRRVWLENLHPIVTDNARA
jgi:hypothetical protein